MIILFITQTFVNTNLKSINLPTGVDIGDYTFSYAGCKENTFEAGVIVCWCEKVTAMPCPPSDGLHNCQIVPDSNSHVYWSEDQVKINTKVRTQKG